MPAICLNYDQAVPGIRQQTWGKGGHWESPTFQEIAVSGVAARMLQVPVFDPNNVRMKGRVNSLENRQMPMLIFYRITFCEFR